MYHSPSPIEGAELRSAAPLVLAGQSPAGSGAKRALDLAASLGALIFFAPLLLLIALLIRLDSPGPALFRQKRGGLGGQPFVIYKFRSMRVQEDGDKIAHCTKGDARVTRVGAFLRRTSLDELPQLLNVLKGDMSLVGPRPHQRHVTLQHVQQLGQLVQAGAAEKGADPRHPSITLGAVGDLVAIFLHPHRAELVDDERLTTQPAALLTEQGGTRRVEPDKQGDEQQQRSEEDQCAERSREVERTLCPASGRALTGKNEGGGAPQFRAFDGGWTMIHDPPTSTGLSRRTEISRHWNPQRIPRVPNALDHRGFSRQRCTAASDFS